MAKKPKNANIDIRQMARVFDEQAFVYHIQDSLSTNSYWER